MQDKSFAKAILKQKYSAGKPKKDKKEKPDYLKRLIKSKISEKSK